MTGLAAEWTKSTRSNGSDACVEVRQHGGAVEVRDTKDRSGPVLEFTPAEWAAFMEGAQNGEFDLA